jgi:hypothetical protein
MIDPVKELGQIQHHLNRNSARQDATRHAWRTNKKPQRCWGFILAEIFLIETNRLIERTI